MPSHVPRTDTTKKRQQLDQRELELEHAVRSDFPREKLVQAAEALRTAHLSLLKAERYWAEDARIQGRDVEDRLRKLQEKVQEWQEKSVDEILKNPPSH